VSLVVPDPHLLADSQVFPRWTFHPLGPNGAVTGRKGHLVFAMPLVAGLVVDSGGRDAA